MKLYEIQWNVLEGKINRLACFRTFVLSENEQSALSLFKEQYPNTDIKGVYLLSVGGVLRTERIWKN